MPSPKRSKPRPDLDPLPAALRRQVKQAVGLLGDVIRQELGEAGFQEIERLRRRMAGLRGRSVGETHPVLRATLRELQGIPEARQFAIAHAFTLMLELMNACENAYRTFRLREARQGRSEQPPDAVPARTPDRTIVYVLTAHPTESRAPANIALFRQITETLAGAYEEGFENARETLQHLLEICWRLRATRARKPTTEAEAEHIYSILLSEEALSAILKATDASGAATSARPAAVYVRTWVGGDKDGHPFVDERALKTSFQLARRRLLRHAMRLLSEAWATVRLIPSASARLAPAFRRFRSELRPLASLAPGDGKRARRCRQKLRALMTAYEAEIGALHPALGRLDRLNRIFPAWVVPLELRESSDRIMEAARGDGSRPAPIARMLRALGELSRGGDPLWYARGLIISMAHSKKHIDAASALVRRALGALRIPVIPLFEDQAALESALAISRAMLEDLKLREAIRRHWGGHLEIMVGYSDSSKEMGVLPSRLALARAVQALDRGLRRQGAPYGIEPLFFHGAGGSVDRGGGSVEEQTAWLPPRSLRIYKATIQGEMIERSFASSEIALRQLERIAEASGRPHSAAVRSNRVSARIPIQEWRSVLRSFAERIQSEYQAKVSSPRFLAMAARSTPYRYLSALRLGSRPANRAAEQRRRQPEMLITSLRAIPWVLCWTQTRVLFPTWWGVGTAWQEHSSPGSLRHLRLAYDNDPVFRTFIKALGFTLAKTELPIWRIYLENGLDSPEREQVERTYGEFVKEYDGAVACVRAISGHRDLLWFRPWLGASIALRAPMIHPLNLLQILSLKGKRPELLRETVTGIATGMLTTG